MSAFVNPLKPRRGTGYAEALTRIKAWTRELLPPGDPAISVTELACAEVGCPPRETIVLVMWENQPAWKLRVHKAMVDVDAADIGVAMATRETVSTGRGQQF